MEVNNTKSKSCTETDNIANLAAHVIHGKHVDGSSIASTQTMQMKQESTIATVDSKHSKPCDKFQNNDGKAQNDDEKCQNHGVKFDDNEIQIQSLFDQTQIAICNNHHTTQIESLLERISILSNVNQVHPIYQLLKAKKEKKTVDKMTLLHYACKKRNKAAVQLLLNKFNADPNVHSTKYRNYPIHIASTLLCPKILQLLIDAGAIVNAPNKKKHIAINIIGKKYISQKEAEFQEKYNINYTTTQNILREKQLIKEQLIECKVLLFNATKQLESEKKETQNKQIINSKKRSRITGIIKNQTAYRLVSEFKDKYDGNVKIKIIKVNLGGASGGIDYSYVLESSDATELSYVAKHLTHEGWVFQESGRNNKKHTFKNHRTRSNDKKFSERLALDGWTLIPKNIIRGGAYDSD